MLQKILSSIPLVIKVGTFISPRSENSTSFIQVFAMAAVEHPTACNPNWKNQSEKTSVYMLIEKYIAKP
jgi:hypothetical protein